MKHKKIHIILFLLCSRLIIDSHFVPIPTLRRDNSGTEPLQVGILTLPGNVRIPTLRRTFPELYRFLLCAEHIELKIFALMSILLQMKMLFYEQEILLKRSEF